MATRVTLVAALFLSLSIFQIPNVKAHEICFSREFPAETFYTGEWQYTGVVRIKEVKNGSNAAITGTGLQKYRDELEQCTKKIIYIVPSYYIKSVRTVGLLAPDGTFMVNYCDIPANFSVETAAKNSYIGTYYTPGIIKIVHQSFDDGAPNVNFDVIAKELQKYKNKPIYFTTENDAKVYEDKVLVDVSVDEKGVYVSHR